MCLTINWQTVQSKSKLLTLISEYFSLCCANCSLNVDVLCLSFKLIMVAWFSVQMRNTTLKSYWQGQIWTHIKQGHISLPRYEHNQCMYKKTITEKFHEYQRAHSSTFKKVSDVHAWGYVYTTSELLWFWYSCFPLLYFLFLLNKGVKCPKMNSQKGRDEIMWAITQIKLKGFSNIFMQQI